MFPLLTFAAGILVDHKTTLTTVLILRSIHCRIDSRIHNPDERYEKVDANNRISQGWHNCSKAILRWEAYISSKIVTLGIIASPCSTITLVLCQSSSSLNLKSWNFSYLPLWLWIRVTERIASAESHLTIEKNALAVFLVRNRAPGLKPHVGHLN